MKHILFVGDGMADEPQEVLEGRTPLEAAKTPNLDRISHKSFVGQVQTVFRGLACGSDIANLTLLGYNPHKLPKFGRGSLEAASMGVDIPGTGLAYRCNLVTFKDGKLTDYSAGQVPTERSRKIIKALSDKFSDETLQFYTGVDYRHLFVLNPADPDVECFPPHDYMDEPINNILPRGGRDEKRIRNLIYDAHEFLKSFIKDNNWADCEANAIWPWGAGKKLSLQSFLDKFSLEGSVISAVDLLLGIGTLAGLKKIVVPGATGRSDTDYSAKMSYGLKALEERKFLFIHVESPDEAGHHGDPIEKVRTIEDIDNKMIGMILDELAPDEFRLLFMPDHATPVRLRTHVYQPVPYMIHPCPVDLKPSGTFTEKTASNSGVYIKEGWKLIDKLLEH